MSAGTATVGPVEAAVAPLKADAVESAEKHAREIITQMNEKMAAHGWVLDEAAPRGTAADGYRREANDNLHRLYDQLTATDWPGASRTLADPDKRKRSVEREARFIKESREHAAAQYDAFVVKLVAKVGPCLSATLEGSHVWGWSILSVVKAGVAEPEQWKTRQIINMSRNGKLFPQWPTRLLGKRGGKHSRSLIS